MAGLYVSVSHKPPSLDIARVIGEMVQCSQVHATSMGSISQHQDRTLMINMSLPLTVSVIKTYLSRTTFPILILGPRQLAVAFEGSTYSTTKHPRGVVTYNH